LGVGVGCGCGCEGWQVWLADGVVHGVRHAKGDRKRTWEVLRDESLHSYVMTNNPTYKVGCPACVRAGVCERVCNPRSWPLYTRLAGNWAAWAFVLLLL
jgi:hypothetical protein